ncbi:MAG: dipicolinate synthase subunit DpsA [Clostridia bacterium]|nr:dipicolinate synthase subunit DpsA [Clostridia bacterium]
MNDNYNDIKLAVIGGDLRMIYCASALADKGFEVCFCGFDSAKTDCGGAVRCRTPEDAVKGAAAVVLPVPYSADGCRVNAPFSASEIRISELLPRVMPTQLLLGGVLSDSFIGRAEELSITVTDYMKDEELTVKNAVTTAEGALELALRELPVTLHNKPVLVLGYGRVGKAVSSLFKAVGCNVTVCARRGDALAWADAAGCRTAKMKDICRAVPDKSVIINTVPELILDKIVLSFADEQTLILDLASHPGGVDFEAAARLGIRTVHALSLPGKTAPVTAGEDIADAVVSILSKRGVI